MCELNFLPLRPGALEDEELAEFTDQGIVNAAGEVSLCRSHTRS